MIQIFLPSILTQWHFQKSLDKGEKRRPGFSNCSLNWLRYPKWICQIVPAKLHCPKDWPSASKNLSWRFILNICFDTLHPDLRKLAADLTGNHLFMQIWQFVPCQTNLGTVKVPYFIVFIFYVYLRKYFLIHRDLKDRTRTELTNITGCSQPCFYRKFSQLGNEDIRSLNYHGKI